MYTKSLTANKIVVEIFVETKKNLKNYNTEDKSLSKWNDKINTLYMYKFKTHSIKFESWKWSWWKKSYENECTDFYKMNWCKNVEILQLIQQKSLPEKGIRYWKFLVDNIRQKWLNIIVSFSLLLSIHFSFGIFCFKVNGAIAFYELKKFENNICLKV